jgi:ABC-2 type transport system permease protein
MPTSAPAFAASPPGTDPAKEHRGSYLYYVWVILWLEGLKMLKDPTEIASRSVQPALWLLIFGQAMNRTQAIPTGGVPYLAFLAPGILAQSITFVSIFNGLAIIWEKDMGLTQKMLTTPIPRSALVLGKMLSASLRAYTQALVILVLSLMMGLHFELNFARCLGVLILIMLGSAFFGGMSMVIASIVRTRDRMMGIGQLVTMPLFFASSALYPLSLMPPWLKALALVNPMSYLVEGLRGLMVDPSYAAFGWDAGILLGASALVLALATRQYPRLLY